MNDGLYTSDEILILASPAVVWDLLINPEKTKMYMYGCEVISDWKPGDPFFWKGSTDGIVYVKGYLVEMDPPRRLKYTVIDPNGTYADIPENYLTVIYELTPENQNTRLKVVQGDYNKVEEGSKRYADAISAGGWTSILEQIKRLAENP